MARRWPAADAALTDAAAEAELGAGDRRRAGAARLARPRRRGARRRAPGAAGGRRLRAHRRRTSRGSRAWSGRRTAASPRRRVAVPGRHGRGARVRRRRPRRRGAPHRRAARVARRRDRARRAQARQRGLRRQGAGAGRGRPSATSSTRLRAERDERRDARGALERAEEHLLGARAVRHALRPGADAPAADRARLAAGALRRDPRRRHQRQELDGADGGGAARGPRRARRRVPLAAPDHVRRADPDRRRRPRARRLRRRRRSARRRPPPRSTAALEEGDRVTQFELLTAAAFDELARRGVEVAVVEAGLGGRHDATGVLRAPVVVLTNVGLEHTRWLGPTSPTSRARSSRSSPGRDARARATCEPEVEELARGDRRADRAGREPRRRRAARLPADELRASRCAAARAALGALDAGAVRRRGARISVPGRLQVIAERPLTILDGAHNPSGVAALADALPERPFVAVSRSSTTRTRPRCSRAAAARCAAARLHGGAEPARAAAGHARLARRAARREAEIVRAPRAALARAQELAGPDGAVRRHRLDLPRRRPPLTAGRRRASAL